MTMMQSRLAGHAQNASLETDRTRTIINKENVKESGGLPNLARRGPNQTRHLGAARVRICGTAIKLSASYVGFAPKASRRSRGRVVVLEQQATGNEAGSRSFFNVGHCGILVD